MRREQNFTQLLRTSKFFSFDRTSDRIYVQSPLAKAFDAANPAYDRGTAATPAAIGKPFFGFKKDINATLYGKAISAIKMGNLDGAYGQCQVENAALEQKAGRIIGELQRLLGRAPCEARAEALRKQGGGRQAGGEKEGDFVDGQPRRTASGGAVTIPGRLLSRTADGGYAVGVAGIVARLPAQALAPTQSFSSRDLANRCVYWFYLTDAFFDAAGRPTILLSLRAEEPAASS